MAFIIQVVFYVLLFCHVQKVYSDEVKDDEDFKCQEMFTYGYGYPLLFPIPESSFFDNGTILLNFSVMTTNDAHILLSANPVPLGENPVYEIVLGGWSNTQSVIRRARQGSHMDQASTMNIVSPTSMRNFWIKQENGLLTVGKENGDIFLGWRDNDPIQIKYMSFASWSTASAKWIFDCKVEQLCTIDWKGIWDVNQVS